LLHNLKVMFLFVSIQVLYLDLVWVS